MGGQIDFRCLYEKCLAGILLTDKDMNITQANQSACELLGYSNFEDIDQLQIDSYHINSSHQELFNFYIEKSLLKGKPIVVDFPFLKKDGDTVWLSISAIAIDAGEEPDLSKGVVWTLVDISSRKQVEEKLTQESNTDYLTGISNRRHFFLTASKQISFHARNKRTLSVLMLDIDNFKAVNDSYGHAVGDQSICMLSDICQDSLRHEDILGRLGGEEFAILFSETDIENAKMIAERIREKVEKMSQEMSGPEFTVSIGAAELRENDNIDSLLSRADGALYVAKHRGRNQVVEVQ
ncbi:sensor domain-containing diguanylate cyclase [Vibrio hannami]|uniref:sensor domain-containing diguanylate cyclase n=1 Tax=Vibrio hannami TaxID=2717094 RepID=UPI003EBAA2FB